MMWPRLEQQLRQVVRNGSLPAQSGREAADLLSWIEDSNSFGEEDAAPMAQSELCALFGRLKVDSMSLVEAQAWEDVALAAVEEGALEQQDVRETLVWLRERQIETSRREAEETGQGLAAVGNVVGSVVGSVKRIVDTAITVGEPTEPPRAHTPLPSGLVVGDTEDSFVNKYRNRNWNGVVWIGSGILFFVFGCAMAISIATSATDGVKGFAVIPALFGTTVLTGFSIAFCVQLRGVAIRFPKDGTRAVEVQLLYPCVTKMHRGTIDDFYPAWDGMMLVEGVVHGKSFVLSSGTPADCQREWEFWKAYLDNARTPLPPQRGEARWW